ncbi:MAG: FKBP-type peptidyl-prolyl cis-trans isomerase [Flammeovirgaceae bacterium]
MYKKSAAFLIVAFLITLWSCEETATSTLTQAERDDQVILDYLSDQNITDYVKTESGMYYRYLTQNPTGAAFSQGLVAQLGYEGKLFYGDIFDSSLLRGDTIKVEGETGRIFSEFAETAVSPPLDTAGGRTADTVSCAAYTGFVIRGWVEALEIIKTGESMEFYIPSNLAYGAGSSGIIPNNTPIMFRIDAYSPRISVTGLDERCPN